MVIKSRIVNYCVRM